jgi:uncharacterized protein YndB with AHSA1/START domain
MSAVANVPTLIVRRSIAASAEELFDAWLDPASLAVWMRPGDVQHITAKIDARVGGRFEIMMHGATDTYPHTGTYQVIDRPRRLVFTWNSRATQQIDSLVTVEFQPTRGATEIVLTHERLPDAVAVAKHTSGWSDILMLIEQVFGKQRSIA